MKEVFKSKKFRFDTLQVIGMCDEIMSEYAEKGFDLTLRQLYYQLVANDYIANEQREYTRLGSIVNDARLAGLLDWDILVDRGRGTLRNIHWEGPRDILEMAAEQFRIDRWKNQPIHIEVMCEKQALEGVLGSVCEFLDVSFSSNKGYSSQSFMYRKGMEIRQKLIDGKPVAILYFGDHDSSGIDMDRDILERLRLFALKMFPGDGTKFVQLSRVALTMEQIESFKPPPNPAKITDSRAKEYIRKYGHSSWELDALEPQVLAAMAQQEIEGFIDKKLWNEAIEEEDIHRKKLLEIVESFV
jgi:hypothetical protein